MPSYYRAAEDFNCTKKINETIKSFVHASHIGKIGLLVFSLVSDRFLALNKIYTRYIFPI